jgi:hypothetical protein
MPRVNVEPRAFTDPRFVHLGQLLGTNRYDAIGRMALVWAECTERNRHALPKDELNHLFDDVKRFSDLIIKAKLGRTRREDVYICGTRGRIEWLERIRRASRENGKKGGRPRKTHQEPNKNQSRFRARSTLTPPPALVVVQTEGMVPSSPSPPQQDEEGVEIIHRAIRVVAIQMESPDSGTIRRWLHGIGEHDAYWVAACVLESAKHLATAKLPAYVERLLLNRRQEGWKTDDAQGYVEYQLGKLATSSDQSNT